MYREPCQSATYFLSLLATGENMQTRKETGDCSPVSLV